MNFWAPFLKTALDEFDYSKIFSFENAELLGVDLDYYLVE